jgi:hypothetical protein
MIIVRYGQGRVLYDLVRYGQGRVLYDLPAQSFRIVHRGNVLCTCVHKDECTCVLWVSTLYYVILKKHIKKVKKNNHFNIRYINIDYFSTNPQRHASE